jgi:hypothetical protein
VSMCIFWNYLLKLVQLQNYNEDFDGILINGKRLLLMKLIDWSNSGVKKGL